MTTLTQAKQAIQTRIETDPAITVPLLWPNDDSLLPDVPTPFIVFEIDVERSELVSYGGGRGANRYRNFARLSSYVLIPKGFGSDAATTLGETVAARLRSYRDNDISCFDSWVRLESENISPPGASSASDNYFVATVETEFFFDQIG